MVEVQGKSSSSNFAPAGVNAFTEEWQPSQTHSPQKEPQLLSCPECGSAGPFDKAGTRQTAEGLTLQRYYCKDCNLRFSELSSQVSNVTLVEVNWKRFYASVEA